MDTQESIPASRTEQRNYKKSYSRLLKVNEFQIKQINQSNRHFSLMQIKQVPLLGSGA